MTKSRKETPSKKQHSSSSQDEIKGTASSRFLFVFIAIAILISAVGFHLLSTTTTTSSSLTPLRVVGFLPDYRFAAADLDFMLPRLSELVFFSLEVSPSTGKLSGEDRLPHPDQWVHLRQRCAASGTLLTLAVGGAGRSSGFSAMAESPEKRSRFVLDVERLQRQLGFSRLELNWQFPQSQREMQQLASLCAEIKAQIPSLSLSMAVPPAPGFLQALAAASPALDQLHLMLYLDPSARPDALLPLLRGWVSPEKVTAGVPFFAQDQHSGETSSYEEALARSRQKRGGLAGEMVKKAGQVVRESARLGMGGISVWELGQDCRPHQVDEHVATCESLDESLLQKINQSLFN